MYMWQGPDTRNDSASTIAADVFFTILGMNSSKWQQALVDKGLTPFASAQYPDLKSMWVLYSIYLMPNPGKLKNCGDEILNQIKQWGNDDYFTDEQTERCKRNPAPECHPSKRKTFRSCQLCYLFNGAAPALDYMTDYEKNLQKITRDDIKRFISIYISGKPYVAGMVINPDYE